MNAEEFAMQVFDIIGNEYAKVEFLPGFIFDELVSGSLLILDEKLLDVGIRHIAKDFREQVIIRWPDEVLSEKWKRHIKPSEQSSNP